MAVAQLARPIEPRQTFPPHTHTHGVRVQVLDQSSNPQCPQQLMPFIIVLSSLCHSLFAQRLQHMETRPLDSPSELQGPGRLLRWLVAEGSKVRYGESVAECSAELNEGHFSVVSPFSGVLKRKLVGVGESFGVGAPLGELSVCKHPAFFRDLCVSCGVHMSKTPSGEEGGAATLISTTTKERVILSGGHTITLTDGEAREMKGGHM